MRADVQILRTIIQHIQLDSDTAVVTALHEAERCADGRAVFVQTYHGTQRLSIKCVVSISSKLTNYLPM